MVSALALAGILLSASPVRAGPVVIVGVDGLTFDVVDPLVQSGKLPNIAAILRAGLRAELLSEEPMRSPALWTTIATGQPRSVHQIYDFVTDSAYWPKHLRSDKKRLVTSDMRRAPALWQLVGAAGKRSLVVGWLNTWPAEEVRGVMFAPYVALNQRRQATIKGRIYLDADEQAYPPGAWREAAAVIVPTDEVPDKRVRRIIDPPPAGSRLYSKVAVLERYVFATRWSLASTLTNTRIIETMATSRERFDLVMTYFDGADTLAHRFWVFRQSVREVRARLSAQGLDPALAPELKQRFGRAVDGYYKLVDEMVGRITAAAGTGATVIIISDHGWGSSSGSRARIDSVPFDGEHRLKGVFMARGPAIRPGRLPALTLYDIAPTVLYLLGIDAPEALPGRVVVELIKKRALAQKKVQKSVAPQPTAPPARERPDHPAHEDEELERLRSLGYIEED